jgi:hypothetical protein
MTLRRQSSRHGPAVFLQTNARPCVRFPTSGILRTFLQPGRDLPHERPTAPHVDSRGAKDQRFVSKWTRTRARTETERSRSKRRREALARAEIIKNLLEDEWVQPLGDVRQGQTI